MHRLKLFHKIREKVFQGHLGGSVVKITMLPNSLYEDDKQIKL